MYRIFSTPRLASFAAIAGSALLASGFAASAQTYSIVHSFGAVADGTPISPGGKLSFDSQDNILGTSGSGGTHQRGTVYRLTQTGIVTVLHSFEGADDRPSGGVIADATGNLYGTTAGNANVGVVGSVFELTPAGNEQSLRFSTTSGPMFPFSGLAFDHLGNAASISSYGGTYGKGTVFKVAPTGILTTVYTFDGANNGGNPLPGDLAVDPQGNLYGTAESGGSAGGGIINKIAPSGAATTLYSFGVAPTVCNGPTGGLVRDAAGNLYGTTVGGGADQYGCIYKLTSSGILVPLYSIPANWQVNGGLARDAAGNLYGTTQYGGTNDYGQLYSLNTSGVLTILHSFGGVDDGLLPGGNLAIDPAGNVYGTAGGEFGGGGIVWKLAP